METRFLHLILLLPLNSFGNSCSNLLLGGLNFLHISLGPSSILAWRIPGTEEPVGLLSMGSHRVGHDWRDLAAAVAAVHILLKSSLRILTNALLMWKERYCVVVWTYFGIALLWDWSKNWSLPVLWPLLSFPNLLAYWVKHFNSILF